MCANTDSDRYRRSARKAQAFLITKLYRGFIYAVLAFLLAPLAVIVLVSFQSQPYPNWPLGSFTLEWYAELESVVMIYDFVDVVIFSTQLAFVNAFVATLVGGLAAASVVRYDFKYDTAIETLLLSPVVYPWLLIGFGILLLLQIVENNIPGQIQLSFWTVLAGHVLFSFPYTTRAVMSSLNNFNTSLEESAQNLGATELKTYFKITIPLITPGIMSGFIMVFIISFNNFIVSLFLTGSGSQTVPIVLFSLIRTSNNPPAQVAALGTLIMAGILSVVLASEYFAGISDYL